MLSSGASIHAELAKRCGLCGLTAENAVFAEHMLNEHQWDRVNTAQPSVSASRSRQADSTEPRAAATLPSGHVFVFDAGGRLVERDSGMFEVVKRLVFKDLLDRGRFFWIHTLMEPFWERSNENDPDGTGRGYVPWFQVTATAIQCTAGDWLEGGNKGQPAGRVTWVWPERGKQEFPPEEIWKLIREAALAQRPRVAARKTTLK